MDLFVLEMPMLFFNVNYSGKYMPTALCLKSAVGLLMSTIDCFECLSLSKQMSQKFLKIKNPSTCIFALPIKYE